MTRSVLMVGNFLSETVPGSRHPCEDIAARLGAAGWRVLTTSSLPGRVPRALDMLSTAWKLRHEYAVAHVDLYGKAAFLWAEAVCTTLRAMDKPFVVTIHDGDFPAFAARHRRRVERILRLAAAVTVPSGYLQSRMRPYRTDLILLPNALDLSVYRFLVRETARPRLIWVRAFHEMYNPCLAAQALALLAREFPDVRLTMLGYSKKDGSKERFAGLVRELGLADRVVSPGGVAHDHVPVWLASADVFLNTTNVDNTPVSVLEAMASGLCVVSTEVGGIPYVLDDGVNGLCVPPDDPERLASAVHRILLDDELAERLSHQARAKVEQYDWSVVLPQWNRLLATVAEAGSPVAVTPFL
jgi:glycosyltransferase involved in cell wall biosynthesis